MTAVPSSDARLDYVVEHPRLRQDLLSKQSRRSPQVLETHLPESSGRHIQCLTSQTWVVVLVGCHPSRSKRLHVGHVSSASRVLDGVVSNDQAVLAQLLDHDALLRALCLGAVGLGQLATPQPGCLRPHGCCQRLISIPKVRL